jgi:RND family efflux transporter MFP subunit
VKVAAHIILILALPLLALGHQFPAFALPPDTAGPAQPADVIGVSGRTQCVLGKRSLIAPVARHPVVEVLVGPGDRVKKGQMLIRLDADEPEADVRAMEDAVTAAQITSKEARRYKESTEKLFQSGALPEHRYFEIQTAVLRAEASELAAVAALDSAKAELEHYTLRAPTDGVVGELTVCPGAVGLPGRTVWGDILDLSEIDVRCELSVVQADRVHVGQLAEILPGGGTDLAAIGKVVFIGLQGDDVRGVVPIHIRVANPDGRFRCGLTVEVRVGGSTVTGTQP